MNPYMDNILENAGSYAVYGKALGDKMRKDVVYGTDPWPKAAGGVPGIVGKDGEFDTRTSRIEQLRGEIASLEKQIKDYDTEAEMGKYKFLYDADPSTYTAYQQNKRTAEQTEKIRKATEDATKQSNAQNQWNNLTDKREVAEWALRSAKNKFDEAERTQNVAGMKEARDEIERYTRAVGSIDGQMDKIRAKFMKDLDISDEGATDVDMSGYDSRIGNSVVDESLSKDIAELKGRLDTGRKAKYSKEEIAAVAAEANAMLPELRQRVEQSNMGDTQKASLISTLDELDMAANNWRGTGANKPKKETTPEEAKAAAEKAVFNADGKMKNPAQLAKLGAKTLRAYQTKYGWNLKDGIDRADRDGNK